MVTVEIRRDGSITLPEEILEKLSVADGDVLTVLEGNGMLVLVPRQFEASRLVAELQRLREQTGLTVDDLLEGLEEQRERYYREHYGGDSE